MANGRWQNAQVFSIFHLPSAIQDAFFSILLDCEPPCVENRAVCGPGSQLRDTAACHALVNDVIGSGFFPPPRPVRHHAEEHHGMM
jgi:hypothetical protein